MADFLDDAKRPENPPVGDRRGEAAAEIAR
jgi:hypothetical protein